MTAVLHCEAEGRAFLHTVVQVFVTAGPAVAQPCRRAGPWLSPCQPARLPACLPACLPAPACPGPPQAQEFPSLIKPLLTERDQFMTFMLRKLAGRADTVVAVVGAGHLQGIRWVRAGRGAGGRADAAWGSGGCGRVCAMQRGAAQHAANLPALRRLPACLPPPSPRLQGPLGA